MSFKLNRKHSLLAVLALIPIVLLVTANMAVGSGAKEINAVGADGVQINQIIFSTFHFAPGGTIHVKTGSWVAFKNVLTTDPHTFSVVNQADLPTNFNDIFACGAPGTVCGTILAGHFPSGFGGPSVQVLNAGGSGLDSTGDSVLLFPGQTYLIQITAPPHTTLHIMCGIHAWMQTTIVVDG